MSSSPQVIESKQDFNRPIRCLVIQLARLGDTLQSLMALRAAKQLYPNLEIHFLAREKFAAAAKRVPWIQNVITLPTDTLLGPIFSGIRSESETLAEVANWVKPLVHEPWDMIVNWSFSEASSFLTGLLPGRVKLGYTRNRDGTFAGADGWSHYVQAIVQGEVPQNIHLTDVLTTQLLTALQIHVGDAVANGNSLVTSKTFFSLTLTEREVAQLAGDSKRKWIAIQLGAGKAEKTWAPKNWAQFAFNLLERNQECGIFLLGGKEDAEREQIFKDELNRLVEALPNSTGKNNLIKHGIASFVGETSFDLWASLVSRSQWLIAGDTAAIHLASLLGTRVLNLSVGPVRFSETGPYGNGHYIVTSAIPCEACINRSPADSHTCKNDISPEAAYAVWSYAANEWAHRRQTSLETYSVQIEAPNLLGSTLVYRSKIRPTQDGGGVVFEAVLQRPARTQDWSAMVMGHVARSWYCGWVPSIGNEITREMVSPALLKHLRELEESTEVLSKICTQAILIGNTLGHRGSALKSPNLMSIQEREELQDLGRKLLELQKLVDRLGQTHHSLLGFSKMLAVQMHHLKGNHLGEMGKESAQCYKLLRDGVAIYSLWIKHTLSLTKPVAIRPNHLTLVEAPSTPSTKELNP